MDGFYWSENLSMDNRINEEAKNKPPYIDVTNEEVEKHMRPHLEHYMKGVVPRIIISDKQNGKYSKGNTKNKVSKEASLPEGELHLLQSVFEEPYLSVGGRAEALGFSSHKNNELKKSLLLKGLIVEMNINLGFDARGIVQFASPTKEGYEALHKRSPKLPQPLGASSKHVWWQCAIATHSEKEGYKAEIEKPLPNGKKVDVYLVPIRGGKPTAVEVELTPKNAVNNVKKNLEPNVLGKIMVACENKMVKQSVEKKLERELTVQQRELVQVMLLSDFHFVKDIIKKAKG
jgi:hypothetical protein